MWIQGQPGRYNEFQSSQELSIYSTISSEHVNTDFSVSSQLLKLARAEDLCPLSGLTMADSAFLLSAEDFLSHCAVSDLLPICLTQGGDFHIYHHRTVCSLSPNPWYLLQVQTQTHTNILQSCSPLFLCVAYMCLRILHVCVHAEAQGRYQELSLITCPPYPGSLQREKKKSQSLPTWLILPASLLWTFCVSAFWGLPHIPDGYVGFLGMFV